LFRRTVAPREGAWARLAIVPGYGDHSGRYLEPMTWWAERGIATHALDPRGHGRAAGGRGAVRRWEEYLADLAAFLGWLTERPGPPLFLLGHSHGGLVVAAAATRALPDVAGCVLSNPFLRSAVPVPAARLLLARLANSVAPHVALPPGVRHEWMSRDEEQTRRTREDPLVFRTATPRWFFTTRATQERVLAAANRVHLPLLLLAGEADPIADPAAAREFFARVGSADKTLRVLPEALHEILREADRAERFAEVHAWLRARVPEGA